MQTKEIEVDGKKYTIKEIKYKDLAGLGNISQNESAMQMMTLSLGITEEEYDELSMKNGIILQKEINELNGLDNFQKPQAN